MAWENENTDVNIVGGKMPTSKPDPKILSKSGVRKPTQIKIHSKHQEDADDAQDTDDGHSDS